MKELWDLYDKNRVLMGKTHVRGIPLESGQYHLVVEIWTVDGAGHLLLTKRHPDKHYGGLWECTGGSVVAGEDSITGAKRELLEETGIHAEEKELVFLGSIQNQHNFFDTYLLKKSVPIGELKLQPEEVTDAKWVTLPEFEQMCAEGLMALPTQERFSLYREKLLPYWGC